MTTNPSNPESNWALTDQVLKGLCRPRPGDSKGATHWPSEGTAIVDGKVVGQCRRQAFYRFLTDAYAFSPERYESLGPLVKQLKEEYIPVSPYMRFTWAQGELYEEYMVDQAKNNGVFVYGQVPIYVKDYNISGKIDLIVMNPETGKLSVCEIKSVYGFGANATMGSDTDRRHGRLGVPKDKNFIQTAMYDWWFASKDSGYEDSRLIYGARDTGKYAEYIIRTIEDEDTGIIAIWYKGMAPFRTSWVKSGITINSVLEQYAYVADHVEKGEVPPRDFKMSYDRADFDSLYADGELTKAERTQYDKIIEREAENANRVLEGQKPKVELKLPAKGSFNCRYCNFSKTCWGTDIQIPQDEIQES